MTLYSCVSDCRGKTKLSVFEGDIRDGEFVRKACRAASVVFHTASIIDVNESVEYSEMYGVNVTGSPVNHSFPWIKQMTEANFLLFASQGPRSSWRRVSRRTWSPSFIPAASK